MEDETTAQDGAWYEDYLPEDAASPDDDAEDTSPSDDYEPDETDQAAEATDDQDEAEDEDAEDEDPAEALEREREARRQLEEHLRQRAEQDAQREAERQQAERQRAEQQRIWNRQKAWNDYQAEKRRIRAARVQDSIRAAQSSDPALMAQHLAMLRDQEERTADHKYYTWFTQDQAAERAQLAAERDRAAVREYADYVRESYGLPYDELKRILRYKDGTPVDPNAMIARAAEILEERREKANLKRRLTRQAREQGKNVVRRRSQAAPGRSGGVIRPEELEGTLEELEMYFPRGRRAQLRRVS